jgi:hypothetical protein
MQWWAVLVRAGVTRQGYGLEGWVPMRAETLGVIYSSLLNTLKTMASTSTRPWRLYRGRVNIGLVGCTGACWSDLPGVASGMYLKAGCQCARGDTWCGVFEFVEHAKHHS